MSGDMQMEEKSRTCPSCRCSISVLATKCRFCGETVGKPKMEVRQLSVNDLGGESVRHQAVSSNVISALDEMRKEAGGSGFPDLEGADDDEASGDDGIGGIDVSGLDDFDQPSFRSHTPKVHKISLGDRVMTAAKIMGVLVVVAVIAIKGPGMLAGEDITDRENPTMVAGNEALKIIENNGDLLDAMRAAVKAKSETPSAENDKIADDVLALVIADIDELINANLWDMPKLKKASSISNELAKIYPSGDSNDIKSEVRQDFKDYSMILLPMDNNADTAIFQLISGNKVTVKKGELVAGRFRVVSIESNSVRVKDIKRNNRDLVCKMAQGPR